MADIKVALETLKYNVMQKMMHSKIWINTCTPYYIISYYTSSVYSL